IDSHSSAPVSNRGPAVPCPWRRRGKAGHARPRRWLAGKAQHPRTPVECQLITVTQKLVGKETLAMNVALISHDPASGRITVQELQTIAVIEPCVNDRNERMWDEEVTIRLTDRTTMLDTDPGHAIMEVLGLYAEDG